LNLKIASPAKPGIQEYVAAVAVQIADGNIGVGDEEERAALRGYIVGSLVEINCPFRVKDRIDVVVSFQFEAAHVLERDVLGCFDLDLDAGAHVLQSRYGQGGG